VKTIRSLFRGALLAAAVVPLLAQAQSGDIRIAHI
jgi:hypothetical protein